MRVQRVAALNSSGRDQALVFRLPRFGFGAAVGASRMRASRVSAGSSLGSPIFLKQHPTHHGEDIQTLVKIALQGLDKSGTYICFSGISDRYLGASMA